MSDEDLGEVDGFRVGFAAGSRIAGYRLEGKIGRGGMAEVFRARDERLGRLVALKILAPALAADEGFRQRFIRESRAAAAVDDPHIVPVFEAGEADGVLFIAMRYVPGGDARSLVQREGPLPPGRAVAIISPVASALDAAHAAGLLHRDVKPANMLVNTVPGRPDHVYLSDFGLSKAAMSSTGLTRKGEFLGTPEYVSPEQIAGQPADGRADEYALACSAFELLTGGPPFRRDEAVAVMYAQLSAPPPRLTSLRPDLPSAVDAILAKALSKAPEDRYASCREFADALRGALGLPPYDTGPGVIRPAGHPATKIAGSASAGSEPQGGWAAVPAAATVPPGLADQPTGASPVAWPPAGGTPVAPPQIGVTPVAPPQIGVTPVAPPPAASGPGYPGYPGYPGPQDAYGVAAAPARPRRGLRIAVICGAAAVVLAAGGVVAAILAGHHGPSPVVSPITATSALPAVGGDAYVVFQGGPEATAFLTGEIRHVTSGEIARLYAQPFPYSRAPAPAGSVTLHPQGGTASYTFRVSPALATRYTVDVLPAGSATAPLASSAARTVYVSAGVAFPQTQTCGRPVCHETLSVQVFVPASVLSSEMSKHWFTYFNLNLAPVIEPAAPTVLLLGAGNPQVSAPQRVSATEFELTFSFSFTIGNDAYHWRWNTCLPDTEAADGMGLPGHHGCGNSSVPAVASYIG